MRSVISLAILAILLLTMPVLLINFASAASPISASAVSLDPWGNSNNLIYRGYSAAVNITLNSGAEGQPIHVFVTLMDRNNVAVGVADTSTVVVSEQTLTVNLLVASYAFTGIGRYIIIVTDANLTPITVFTVPINISLLGDFDFNSKIDFNDILNFVNAFTYYNQFRAIPNGNKIFDMDGDIKIDFNDMLIFSAAFSEFNK